MIIEYQEPYPNDGFKGEDSYTGLRLVVCGQAMAERYEPGDNEVCISIKSPGWGGVRIPELSSKFIDISRFTFSDVETETDGQDITKRDAERLAQFVMKHRDKKKLVIHCFAGISRSRSAAGAIAEALSLPYTYTILNWSVFNAVRDALEKTLKEEGEQNAGIPR